MPKGKKHTAEQIVGILRRIDHGETAEAVCRDVNISQATLHRWKQQYGALEVDEVKELKSLREENAQLKCVVADQALNIHVLKVVNAKNGGGIGRGLALGFGVARRQCVGAPGCQCSGGSCPASGKPVSWHLLSSCG